MKGVLLPRVALAALGIVLAAAGASAQRPAPPVVTGAGTGGPSPAQTIIQPGAPPISLPSSAVPSAQPAVTPAGALGADLSGAACRWEARSDVPIERGVPQAANIYCGDAKHPTGTVSATLMPINLPTDPAARHLALERAAADTPVGREDAARMSCSAGKWDKSGSVDLGIEQCALNDSEWPQVVAVAPTGTLLLRAAGLPSALPAMELAIARMGGLNAADTAGFADTKLAHDRLVQIGGDGWITATSANFDDYDTLTETARTEASRKNYGAAEGHYRNAATILTNVFGAQSPGVGLLLMELALQVSNQERFDEAAALFRRADPIIQTNGTAADRARLLLYQAFDAANRGRFDEALEYANNSASTWRGILAQGGFSADQINADPAQSAQRGELAFSLDLTAEMALRTGNLAAADAAASEAADIITETQGLPPWWRAEVLTTIGEIRAAQGRLNDADNAFRAALILQERLFGNTAPTAVTYLTFARVFSDQKLYEESVRAYRLALNILRKDEVARSEVVVDQIAPFITAANAVAKADPSQAAQLNAELFEATQLIGKSLVDDTVNRVAARLAQAAPAIAGLVDELERTRRERDSSRLALAQEVSLPDDRRGSIRENQLMNQINAAAAKADGLQKQIEAQFPDYDKYANPGPVSLAEAQKALGPDEAFVLIEAGRERSFAILVRKDSMLARPVTLDAGAIADSVTTLRKAFIVRTGQIEPFDLGRAYTLYRALFGGIQTGLTGVNNLIVVPTGALASLPLGLLVTQTPKPRDYTDAQFLIRRTAISVVPSARAFISQREQRAVATTASLPFFAVANPTFSGVTATKAAGGPNGFDALDNECRDAGPVPAQLLRALPPLPDTADEVRKVAAIEHAASGSILMGADATEARVRAMPLGQYHVLYFATHGLLPTALRCLSEPALVLSPPATAATTRDTDGVLDASEVAELHLNADLVVLSACNTATSGGQFGGESLSGLAGAFFHAGARTVLASHWEVPSAQTVQLMTGMFQRLGPNLNSGIADALRQSQLALVAKPETAHPFFWAAFTLIGDGGSAQPHSSAQLSTATGAVATTSGPPAQPLSEKQQ
jgi:CHAT domain-containing protein